LAAFAMKQEWQVGKEGRYFGIAEDGSTSKKVSLVLQFWMTLVWQ
jgi:hypothetical protein